MGTRYEGSLLEWIDQHDSQNHTADELYQMANREGKLYTYAQIRTGKNARRGVKLGADGKPVRGTINAQLSKRKPIAQAQRALPGYFSGYSKAGKAPPPPPPAAAAPLPPKLQITPEAPYGLTNDGLPRKKPGRPKLNTNSKPPKPSANERAKQRMGTIDEMYQQELDAEAARKAAIAEVRAELDVENKRLRELRRHKYVPQVALQRPAAPPLAPPPAPPPPPAGLAVKAEPEIQEDDDPPPIKHTQLRRLILDVGLDVAVEIVEEFRVISERIR